MKRRRPLPSPELVRACVRFDGEHFYWRHRTDSLFKTAMARDIWNRRFPGQRITIKRMRNGYDAIRIHSTLILIHRLIWVLHYGEWPKGELDHINGDIRDNRIENLRDVNKSFNMRNQYLRKDNTSGMPGVVWCKGHKSWRVNVATPERRHYIGSFKTKEEAIQARLDAQVRLGFTARHGTPRPKPETPARAA